MRLIGVGSGLSIRDDEGRSALWWSAVTGQRDLVRELGGPLQSDAEGVGPLHMAAEDGSESLLRALLQFANADDVRARTRAGSTPLLLAAYHDNHPAIDLLLARGAEIDAQNRAGDTALIVAVRRGHLASATVLMGAGASVHRRNKQDISAYTMMQKLSDPEWVQLREQAPSELELLFERITRR